MELDTQSTSGDVDFFAGDLRYSEPAVEIPEYLRKTYWWAYIHPLAIRFFDHQPIINLILWGCYEWLRDVALDEMGEAMAGRSLQVASVYGNLTARLAERVARGKGMLDVIDVVPGQLDNLRRKLPPAAPVRLLVRDSSDLRLPDAAYDRALIFFLPHEQPEAVRRRTLAEVFRVVKPGGKIVIVEFAKPRWWHPLRYLALPWLAILEPFAPDIWKQAPQRWLPAAWIERLVDHQTYFGHFYQKLVFRR